MPKNSEIKKIMVIGSGPIVIGQAAEFDYAGTQACQALREEGYQVVLVNPNPATIMTDAKIADAVYMEPLDTESAERIIYRERPDAILGTLGGQIGLNLTVALAKEGILDKYGVKVIGTDLDAIDKASDRERFKELMARLGEPVAPSEEVSTVEQALAAAQDIGYPVVVRPFYTLGGTGGGFAKDPEELRDIAESGLSVSPVHRCLVERSLTGWKEIEYEVMRDQRDNAIVVCAMENVDPVGIHTGDSIVVAPLQTLTDRENQLLRDVSLRIIRALGICGGCNVQLALNPQSFEYCVIEVNPRVSRSSALASKATGYPIARISAKLAVGLNLDEIVNPVTGSTSADFEPAIDYVVTKFPRFPFDKFEDADRRLGTQMKATGETMALGRTLEESLNKAIRSLENKCDSLEDASLANLSIDQLLARMDEKDDRRLWVIAELFRRGYDETAVHERTGIDMFFLDAIENIVRVESELKNNPEDIQLLSKAKRMGFADSQIARLTHHSFDQVRHLERENGIVPAFKMVDTCAGEFTSLTPYFYATACGRNEIEPARGKKVLVIGSGPIRIGQGVEFDFATVHCVSALRELGYTAICINNNPETVSTDFTVANRLYFEPLDLESVLNVIEFEKPLGVVVQFGGQTAINLARALVERGIKILGTDMDGIDDAEDRARFEALMERMGMPRPEGDTAFTPEEAIAIAHRIGYPVIVRPSYVLGGRAMQVVRNDEQLRQYATTAVKEITHDSPILIDQYIQGREVEIDAISDGQDVLIPGIMSQVERAGIHSGDSISIYPPLGLSKAVTDRIVEHATAIGRSMRIVGLFNIQFDVSHAGEVYILEVNPRSSRTVPFLSKVTDIPMCEIATRCMMGESLKDQGLTPGLAPVTPGWISVKCPVFSFSKLRSVDTTLSPEMKSTGESFGADETFAKALRKALMGMGVKVPFTGNVLFTVADEDKDEMLPIAQGFYNMGYGIYATPGTADFLRENGINVFYSSKVGDPKNQGYPDCLELLRSSKVTFVINTQPFQDRRASLDGFLIRRVAWENGVFCMTCLDTASALLEVLRDKSFIVRPLGERREA